MIWWIDAEVTTDLAHQFIPDLGMTRDCGATIQRSVDEPGVPASLTVEFTAMCAEPAVERTPFHTAMRTSSKCSEAADRASARLASSASSSVIRNVSRRASREDSWQFTPGDRHGEPAIELTVPAPSSDFGQFVLATDENGVMSWHAAVTEENTIDRTRGGATRTYVIRRRVGPHAEVAEMRGLIGAVGKKLFKVLVFPLVDPILGEIGSYFVRNWEKRYRPYLLRPFMPANYQSAAADSVDPPIWKMLSAGKALLFIHGTFSRSYNAFGALDFDTVDILFERYQHRVFAFEHPTLAEDPVENVQWFLEHVPDDIKLDLDIVCHSRGGLVSRQLVRAKRANVSVDRIVFVATPNAGTILTDPEYMGDFIDSYTNILQALPENGVTEILEAIVTIVKQLAVATLDTLTGLQAMLPSGKYLQELAAAIPADSKYYAITSNFEPDKATPNVLWVADKVMDGIFRQKNDFVVPTDGVHIFGNGTLIPNMRLRVFEPPERTPIHTRFFYESRTRDALLEWLSLN